MLEGPNGHGKTNVLEAIDLLAGGRSFRKARPAHVIGPVDTVAQIAAVVKRRSTQATVQLTVSERAVRASRDGNGLRNVAELTELVRTVVFTPADLELVQGSPGERRDWLDAVAASVSAPFRQARANLTRVLTQRARLLTQMRDRARGASRGGQHQRADDDTTSTLAVWDAQLVEVGEHVGAARRELCATLADLAEMYYRRISGGSATVRLLYDCAWSAAGLEAALAQARDADLRSGSNTVGPQRDDVAMSIDDLAARTHRSQGEQRSLALALRLAQCAYVTQQTNDQPVVLLDDVFSELDSGRATRLIGCLPEAQTVLTTATGTLPDEIEPDTHICLRDGAVVGDGS